MIKEQMDKRGYSKLFRECYMLLQEYGEPSDSEKFWSDLVARANEMIEGYRETRLFPMAKAMAIEIVNEIEREWKREAEIH